MKKHPLLVYQQMSLRLRGALLLLWLVLLSLVVVDFFVQSILGPFGFLLWFVLLPLVGIWAYYAYILPRSAVLIGQNAMIVRGPFTELQISYGRIHSVTPSSMAVHFDRSELKPHEYRWVEPFYAQTCVFIGLSSVPKGFKQTRKRFSRLLFSTKQAGLILAVPDALSLSRDVEAARQEWRKKREMLHKKDNRTLASKVLNY